MAMSRAGPREGLTESERAGALLDIATLIARDAPAELVFSTVAEQAARSLGTEAGSVLQFLGEERAVIVGVWNADGIRGFPVNAELDVNPANSAAGRVRSAGRPARADSYEHGTGELQVQMRASALRSSVAAPVMLGDEVWGAVVAITTRVQPLPEGSEHRIADFAGLAALAVGDARRKRRAAASQLRLVEAGDEKLRGLERELHEGVQQHLLALTLRLRVARGRADEGSQVAKLLDDALAEADVANTVLRDLARNLYPIVLTERGLAVALQALVARAGVLVYLRELPPRRFPALVEATAYRVVADVLAAAREDGTKEIAVVVSDRGDHLLLELRSEGDLDAEAAGDRVAAVGGHFHRGVQPEGGSLLRAEIPV